MERGTGRDRVIRSSRPSAMGRVVVVMVLLKEGYAKWGVLVGGVTNIDGRVAGWNVLVGSGSATQRCRRIRHGVEHWEHWLRRSVEGRRWWKGGAEDGSRWAAREWGAGSTAGGHWVGGTSSTLIVGAKPVLV